MNASMQTESPCEHPVLFVHKQDAHSTYCKDHVPKRADGKPSKLYEPVATCQLSRPECDICVEA